MSEVETQPPAPARARGFFRRERGLIAAMIVLAVLKLWLLSWQQITAQGSARFDDYLFVELAEHLKEGDWLGPYTERTLVKGPVYPVWLAAISLARLPLLPAQHVLHAAAAALLIAAIGGLIPQRGARVALFAVLLFDPASYDATSQRVTREGIYTALALLVVAGAAGFACRIGARGRAAWWWAGLLSAALPLFWFTREEGPWILPAVALPLAYAGIGALRASRGPVLLAVLAAIFAPMIALALAQAALGQVNRHYYGVPATIELRAAWFERAYGALTRVDPEHRLWRVPVAASARALLYEASPAFAELETHLEGHARERASVEAAAPDSEVPAEEMMGTWFIWAFRDAAAGAGHHRSLGEAKDYYTRLAGEVNAACADGRLPCGPPHASLAPAWRAEFAEPCWRFARRLSHGLLRMRTIAVEQLPSLAADAETRARYAALTHQRVEGNITESSSDLGFVRVTLLQSIAAIYRALLYPSMLMATATFLAWVPSELRGRRPSASMTIAAGLLGAALLRVGLLTYISASAYPIFHGIYQRAIYPLLYVFVALCLAKMTAVLRARHAAGAAPAVKS